MFSYFIVRNSESEYRLGLYSCRLVMLGFESLVKKLINKLAFANSSLIV